MKFLYRISFLLIFASSSLFSQETFYYTSPKNNSKLVSLETNIILRSNEIIEEQSLSDDVIEIIGTKSGRHFGTITLSGFVTLKIYNALGEEVKTIVNEFQNKGKYSVKFDGSDLSSGIYIYKLTSENHTATKKFILMK